MRTKKSNYNQIFGRELLRELGIQLDFQNISIGWQNINIPKKSKDYKTRTHFTIQDSKIVRNVTKILDANNENPI